jgi:hypothetical protein
MAGPRPRSLLTSVLPIVLACLASFSTRGAESPGGDRPIYRCSEAGVATYSDRPCGASTDVYSWSTPAPAETVSVAPATVSKRYEAKPTRARRERGVRATSRAEVRPNECQRLTAELRQLKSRMRAGYGVVEGERLRDRQRSVGARHRELRCRSS